jgi:hypothetical protein
MSSNNLLRIYLRDHHAAAVAGTELAKRSAKSNAGTPFETLLNELRNELLEDLRSLEEIMSRLGISTAKGKDGAMWMAEKFGRLKLNGSFTAYSPLSRIIEFEGLALNSLGNKGVWSALTQVEHPALDAEELQRLEKRADDQGRRVAEARREAVRMAFAGDAATA